MKDVDVVSYGEVMLRLTPERFKTFLNTSLLQMEIGGTEANVLCGLSLLGLKTQFITFLPDNFLGQRVYNELRRYGIGIDGVKFKENGRIGIYFVEFHHREKGIQVLYDRKNSCVSLYPLEDDSILLLKRAKLLHLTGITPSLSDICKNNILKLISFKDSLLKISLDVNFRRKLWEPEECREFIENIIEKIDILFINIDDFKTLYFKEENPETILKYLQENYGKDKIYILSLGENGSSLLFKDTFLYQEIFQTTPVDKIGAGDAFVAGFLYGYLTNKDLKSALLIGNAMASFKMSVFGDLPAFDVRLIKQFLESLEFHVDVER
jgi:2-dehydro-3-deoxygluconokinase